jgi:iron complex outermembrane receptor protein
MARWGEVEAAFSLQAQRGDGDDSRRVGSDSQSVFDQPPRCWASGGIPGPGQLGYRHRGTTRIDLAYDKFERDSGTRAKRRRRPGIAHLDQRRRRHRQLPFDLGYTDANCSRHRGGLRTRAWTSMSDRAAAVPAGALLPIGTDGNINTSQFVPMLFTDGFRSSPEFTRACAPQKAFFTYNGFTGHSLRIASGYTKQSRPRSAELRTACSISPTATAAASSASSTARPTSATRPAFIEDQDRDIIGTPRSGPVAAGQRLEPDHGAAIRRLFSSGSTVNPRAALVWDASTDLAAKLMYGRDFRA